MGNTGFLTVIVLLLYTHHNTAMDVPQTTTPSSIHQVAYPPTGPPPIAHSRLPVPPPQLYQNPSQLPTGAQNSPNVPHQLPLGNPAPAPQQNIQQNNNIVHNNVAPHPIVLNSAAPVQNNPPHPVAGPAVHSRVQPVHPGQPHVQPVHPAQPAGSQPHSAAKAAPQFAGNTLSFSSNSASGPGNAQCSFSQSVPDTFHATSDGFGYPSNIVEQAAANNDLVKAIFKKYEQSKNSGAGLFSGGGGAPLDTGFGSVPVQAPSFNQRRVGIPAISGFGNTHPQDNHNLNPGAFGPIPGSGGNNNNNIGHFGGDPNFPDLNKAILPGRSFGPGSQLRSSLHRRNPLFSDFGGFQFRRKRQAGPSPFGPGFKNQIEAVCDSNTDYIRAFKKYNSQCYVYRPELQGHKVANCGKNVKCKNCGGNGHCVPEQTSALVWSYCQGGPNARKVELEYIEFPAYCVCKTIHC